MPAIDLTQLTTPISPDEPSGPDLEYDPSFLELEQASRVEPEQQFGDTIIAATEVDWKKVLDLSSALLKQTRDLRIALYATQALAHRSGLEGLSDGLALIRAYVEQFWDSLHPQLDPDDDLDPTARVNIIASLCDQDGLIKTVRSAPMLKLPGLGGLSLRTLQIARGELPPSTDENGGDLIPMSSIEAAAAEIDVDILQAAASQVSTALEHQQAIEQLLVDKVGATNAVGLDALSETLRSMQSFLNGLVAERAPGDADIGEDGSTAETAPGQAQATTGARSLQGDITGPADVKSALDKIIRYYQKQEPSSPVPLLLIRAKRLVSAGFMDILHDIAPDALSQAQQIAGQEHNTDS